MSPSHEQLGAEALSLDGLIRFRQETSQGMRLSILFWQIDSQTGTEFTWHSSVILNARAGCDTGHRLITELVAVFTLICTSLQPQREVAIASCDRDNTLGAHTQVVNTPFQAFNEQLSEHRQTFSCLLLVEATNSSGLA